MLRIQGTMTSRSSQDQGNHSGHNVRLAGSSLSGLRLATPLLDPRGPSLSQALHRSSGQSADTQPNTVPSGIGNTVFGAAGGNGLDNSRWSLGPSGSNGLDPGLILEDVELSRSLGPTEGDAEGVEPPASPTGPISTGPRDRSRSPTPRRTNQTHPPSFDQLSPSVSDLVNALSQEILADAPSVGGRRAIYVTASVDCE